MLDFCQEDCVCCVFANHPEEEEKDWRGSWSLSLSFLEKEIEIYF